MAPENIIYLVSGLLSGGVAGYFLYKILHQRKNISIDKFESLQTENYNLKIENARRLTSEEVSLKYVSKEVHDLVKASLDSLRQEFKKEKETNENNQSFILKLTSEVEQKLSREEVERGFVAKETFDVIREKLEKSEKESVERGQIILDLTGTITKLKEQEKFLNEKLTLFREEIEKLHLLSAEQFRNLASDILEEKKRLFIESNQSALNTILDPLKTDLSGFKKTIEDTRKEDIRDLTSLKKEIDSLQKLNVQLSDDARNLANALKSEVKVQGNWGEDRLHLILETEGLQKYIDYTSQQVFADDEAEKNRKPDLILRLPQGRHLVIDSKVSLTAYVNYFNAGNAHEKTRYLQLHLKSITEHIDELAEKNYQSLAGLNSPDYVFLFMPIEGALTLALNTSPEILERALRKKIVMITPTNLVATLKVVKILWQQENQVKNVQEIFRQCGALYDKFVAFLESMEAVGSGLNGANSAYRDAMNHLMEGTKKGTTIIGRFDTIKKLEAKTNKNIPDKYLTSLDVMGETEMD